MLFNKNPIQLVFTRSLKQYGETQRRKSVQVGWDRICKVTGNDISGPLVTVVSGRQGLVVTSCQVLSGWSQISFINIMLHTNSRRGIRDMARVSSKINNRINTKTMPFLKKIWKNEGCILMGLKRRGPKMFSRSSETNKLHASEPDKYEVLRKESESIIFTSFAKLCLLC